MVTLERKVVGVPWSGDDLVIAEGDEVRLRWDGDYVSSCLGTGSGFSTLGVVNGSDTDITEPSVGNSYTYTVICTGDNGSTTDSLSISAAFVPTATLTVSVFGVGVWSNDDITINNGENVALELSLIHISEPTRPY